MLRGLLLALVALTLIAPAVIAPAAFAADDEIFVDPGSPSGKEYALPVHRARQQAAGDRQGAKGATSAPLFGEGVDAARSGATAGGRSGRSTDASDASAGSSDAGASRDRGASAQQAAPKTLKAQAAAPDGGIGDAAIIGGVSVGVLLLGAVIGVLLRRRAWRAA